MNCLVEDEAEAEAVAASGDDSGASRIRDTSLVASSASNTGNGKQRERDGGREGTANDRNPGNGNNDDDDDDDDDDDGGDCNGDGGEEDRDSTGGHPDNPGSGDSSADGSMRFHGHFVFQDREAGIYYQAFEHELRTYILQAFHTEVKELSASSATTDAATVVATVVAGGGGSGGGGAGVSGGGGGSAGTQRAPAIRVDFMARQKKDIISTRAYFESLNTSSLPRYQVHFPRCDASRYKELHNHKVRHGTVQMFIANSMQSVTSISPNGRNR